MRIPGLVLACALAAGCLTTTQSDPPGIDAPAMQRGRASRAWIAEEAGVPVGSVVRFDEVGADGRALHVVRDAWGEDLGLVDALGRAWRWRPHVRELQGLGSGTVAQGVERILERRTSLVLREVGLDELAAALRVPPAGELPPD